MCLMTEYEHTAKQGISIINMVVDTLPYIDNIDCYTKNTIQQLKYMCLNRFATEGSQLCRENKCTKKLQAAPSPLPAPSGFIMGVCGSRARKSGSKSRNLSHAFRGELKML